MGKLTPCRFLLIALTALLGGLAGCATNAVTGQLELRLISEDQEVALGDNTHPNVIFMYDGEYHDPELNRYLGTIVMRLHRASHRADMPMDFTMLNTSVVNAFATPAHIYATRGFLAKLQNEAQFAAVMGHELAHVAAGHSARSLTHSVITSVAFSLADVVVGDSLDGSLASTLGEASVTLLGLSYSREQERQADRVGTYYMAICGWDPKQAITMQELLDSLSDREDTVLDKYLSTHPGRENRVREIKGVIDEKKLLSGRYVQGDGAFAERWQQRLKRLREVDGAFGPYDEATKLLKKKDYGAALDTVQRAIRLRDDQAPFHRLKGDALAGLGRYSDAEDAYESALRLDRRYVPANIGLGDVYLKTGQSAKAREQFETAVRGWPGAAVPKYGLGLAMESDGRYEDAVRPLSAAAQSMPNDPDVLYALAVAYDRSGRRAEASATYRRALDAGLRGEKRREAQRRLQ